MSTTEELPSLDNISMLKDNKINVVCCLACCIFHCLFVVLIVIIATASLQTQNEPTFQLSSSNIICDEQIPCINYNLWCSSADCHIVCNGSRSCSGANILCPIDGNCNIKGYQQQSLLGTTINATQSISLTLNCPDSDDACNSMSVYCPDNDGQSIVCNITGVTKNSINKDFNVCIEYSSNFAHEIS